MITFKHPTMRELTDQQVRYAPAIRRQEQLTKAEKLLGEIDPDKTYPYSFVCFRITDFRPTAHANLQMAGQDLTLILTDHANLDYDFIVANSKAILDTRNATKNVKDGRHKITLL